MTAEELRIRMDLIESELARSRAEVQRLRSVLTHAYNCLPDMPSVCCQTVQLAVEQWAD